MQQQQQAFCFPSPSPNPSASATALLQRATMMGTTANNDSSPLLASRSRAEHESIDLLQDMDMDMNMTATMMMGSIPAEAGLGFGGSSSVDGILDPKGGVAGGSKGATRDFLNLSRGFPLPPQRKVDLMGLRSRDIGVQMQEEDQGGNDQHQHHIWFTE
ncbi:hypothetical protein MLD38_015138 [Melastoma candidum]|uniref:Uncharacterized protein n=1 Tax=Melastoma candidum TaxID=119954 RepID=A0ACB9RH07_9MYRT|nr:hypothetical protein MLD38_015138 [Melastoma candidum]